MRVDYTGAGAQENEIGTYLIPVSTTPSTAAEIWAILPVFIIMMVLSMVMKIVTALTEPEVLGGIAKGAVSAAIK